MSQMRITHVPSNCWLDDYVEPDAPYFDPAWLITHPDFPLAATVAVETHRKED